MSGEDINVVLINMYIAFIDLVSGWYLGRIRPQEWIQDLCRGSDDWSSKGHGKRFQGQCCCFWGGKS